jgi:hypothetical protein
MDASLTARAFIVLFLIQKINVLIKLDSGLHPIEARQHAEAVGLPERNAIAVLRDDKDIAFLDTLSSEEEQTLAD